MSSYPRNAATPPIVTVGYVVQISDGAVQTTGASVRVKTGTGAWGAGGGTLACDTTSGAWTYAPTQGETNDDVFHTAVYKANCLGCALTVVTGLSATSGLATANATQVNGTNQTAGDLVGILGALNTAASSGDPGTTTTLVAYLKQIINTLEGTAGIVSYPAAAVAGNAVSLAEVIRSIDTRLPSALSSGNIKTDVIAISGDSTAADNAELAFDGNGFGFTNCTMPTTTTVTNRVTADTDQINGSAVAATRLKNMFAALLLGTVDDATFTPTDTTFETDQTDDDAGEWTNQGLLWVSGANINSTVFVTGYAYANGKVKLTVSQMNAAPADGDQFLKVGRT